MNKELRLNILEAFARSKAYEFDGFTTRYIEEHPQQQDIKIDTAKVDDYTITVPVELVTKKKLKSSKKKTQKIDASTEASANSQTTTSPAES